jgi:tetratricopeptide (TPR) repeat protein
MRSRLPARFRGTLFALFVLLPALAVPRACAEELRLVFERVETTVARPGATPAPAKITQKRSTVTVALGSRYLYESGTDSPLQIDFEHRRMRVSRDDRPAYIEVPLFALIAFREMELSNRLAMRQTFAAMKLKNGPDLGTVLGLEAEFGLPSDAKKGKEESLQSENRGGALVWRINGDTATVCSFTDTALTAPQEAMLGRWYLYSCKLHPEVRTALLQQHRLPRRLIYRWNSMGERTAVELTLQSMTLSADSSLRLPTGLAAEPSFDSTLSVTLNQAREALARCRAGAANAPGVLEQARRAAAEGRGLDALLALSEYELVSCSEPPALDKASQEKVRADKRARLYTDAVRQIEDRKLKSALETLGKIDRTGLEKAYLIDLETATAHGIGGDAEGAAELFQRALRVNPCLVGAWTDLAGTCIGAYDTFDGWICVEAARQAAPPGCRLLEKFDQRERELVKEHPEYFE